MAKPRALDSKSDTTSREAQVALLEGVTLPQVETTLERPLETSTRDQTPTTPFDSQSNLTPSPRDASANIDNASFIIADFAQGKERQVRFDREEFKALASQLTSRGINQPVRGDGAGYQAGDASGDGMTTKGLSWGTDNRVFHGFYPTWPNTTVGRVHARGGTGVLVGRRLVLTCAHCIINEQTGQYMPDPWYFTPRQAHIYAPHGHLKVEYQVNGGWHTSNCHSGGTWANCHPKDWAILVLEDEFPAGHPGWLGFAWLNEQDTRNAPGKRQPGYPCCGNPHSPVNADFDCRNCSNANAWGCEKGAWGGSESLGFQWGQPTS